MLSPVPTCGPPRWCRTSQSHGVEILGRLQQECSWGKERRRISAGCPGPGGITQPCPPMPTHHGGVLGLGASPSPVCPLQAVGQLPTHGLVSVLGGAVVGTLWGGVMGEVGTGEVGTHWCGVRDAPV